MSYDDLRSGILELFDDAARMSRYQVAFGELTLVVGGSKRQARPRARQPEEVLRARRRESEKRHAQQVAQAVRKLRIVERERVAWFFPKRVRAPEAPKQPCYKCRVCSSTSSTHRCPG